MKQAHTARNILIICLVTVVFSYFVLMPALGKKDPVTEAIDSLSRLYTLEDALTITLAEKKTRHTSLSNSLLKWIESQETAEIEAATQRTAMDLNTSRIETINALLSTLDDEIASYGRTIRACDEWLKYHPDATPSEKRKNADAKSKAEQDREEARAEKSDLERKKREYQADNRRRNVLYGNAMNVIKHAESRIKVLDPQVTALGNEITSIEAEIASLPDRIDAGKARVARLKAAREERENSNDD